MIPKQILAGGVIVIHRYIEYGISPCHHCKFFHHDCRSLHVLSYSEQTTGLEKTQIPAVLETSSYHILLVLSKSLVCSFNDLVRKINDLLNLLPIMQAKTKS